MRYLEVSQRTNGEPGSAISSRADTLQAERNADGSITLQFLTTIRYAGGIEHHAVGKLSLSVVQALQLGAVATGWMDTPAKG